MQRGAPGRQEMRSAGGELECEGAAAEGKCLWAASAVIAKTRKQPRWWRRLLGLGGGEGGAAKEGLAHECFFVVVPGVSRRQDAQVV